MQHNTDIIQFYLMIQSLAHLFYKLTVNNKECTSCTHLSLILFVCFSPQSLLNIGAMLGGPLGGWMIDFCGRKIALMLTALPFSAGWLMIGFGKVPGLLHAGRFFSGVGVGCASLIVPVSNETVLLQMQGKKNAARGEMQAQPVISCVCSHFDQPSFSLP